MTFKEAVRKYKEEHPSHGRYRVMRQFGCKEHQAREAINEARKIPPIGIRVAFFDLETTNLKGDIGRIICGSVLSTPSMEMTTFRNDELSESMADDGEIAKRIRDLLESHHIICSWYGKGFDVPFLNTRLVQNGFEKLKTMFHVDGCFYFRGWHGLSPRSSKLDTVSEFFNLDERKMPVDVSVWVRAQAGDREAIDILCERCESDVRLTAEIIERAFDNDIVKSIQRFA